MTTIVVDAGEVASWPLQITSPSRVTWSFRLAKHHVEFYVALRRGRPDGSCTQELLTEKMWIAAESGEQRGEMTLRKPSQMGVLVFVWDNVHSYIRSKDVTFKVVLSGVESTATPAAIAAREERAELAAADALVQSLVAASSDDASVPGVFAELTSDSLVQSLVESSSATKSQQALEKERESAAAEVDAMRSAFLQSSTDLETQFAQWGF